MGKLDTLSSEIIPEHGWVGHVRGEEQGRWERVRALKQGRTG
jgi:hypothetical protein